LHRPCEKYLHNHYINNFRLGKGTSIQFRLTAADPVIRPVTDQNMVALQPLWEYKQTVKSSKHAVLVDSALKTVQSRRLAR